MLCIIIRDHAACRVDSCSEIGEAFCPMECAREVQLAIVADAVQRRSKFVQSTKEK